MERLVIWIIQIDFLQLPPMLWWVLGVDLGGWRLAMVKVCGNYWAVESLDVEEI